MQSLLSFEITKRNGNLKNSEFLLVKMIVKCLDLINELPELLLAG